MSEKQVKLVRGQIRQIVKELLPSIISTEFTTGLMSQVNAQVKKIEEDVKKTMHEMNERHKDTMGYLVRQTAAAPTESKNESK